MSDPSEKMKLFDSDGEEENYDDFKRRPHYEGPRGQEILEINSQLSKRFKLDERFAEDFETETVEDNLSEENEERKKNIRILETVLGHEVGAKPSDKSFKRKLIRFDPDDEKAAELIKNPHITSEKPKKSKKKKAVVEEKVDQNIPVSAERYMEVCPDLKEILNTTTPFSFSQNFSYDLEETESNSQNEDFHSGTKEKEVQQFEKESKIYAQKQNKSSLNFIPKSKHEVFFITKGDPRLKEGVEFFKRPKPLEEIRIMWQKRREHVLELFRGKRRSSQRSYSAKVQSIQMKNTIRRNNFRK